MPTVTAGVSATAASAFLGISSRACIVLRQWTDLGHRARVAASPVPLLEKRGAMKPSGAGQMHVRRVLMTGATIPVTGVWIPREPAGINLSRDISICFYLLIC